MVKYYIGLGNVGTSCTAVIFDVLGVQVSKASRILSMITTSFFQT